MTGAIVEEDAAGINFYQVPRSTGPVAALLLGCRRGTWNPANIGRVGSKARNPLLARNLREFPVAPNIDAGAGTPASAAVVVFQHGQRTRAIPKRLFEPQILGRATFRGLASSITVGPTQGGPESRVRTGQRLAMSL
jgi:hypothetical protein